MKRIIRMFMEYCGYSEHLFHMCANCGAKFSSEIHYINCPACSNYDIVRINMGWKKQPQVL